jgi:hypothetical protein
MPMLTAYATVYRAVRTLLGCHAHVHVFLCASSTQSCSKTWGLHIKKLWRAYHACIPATVAGPAAWRMEECSPLSLRGSPYAAVGANPLAGGAAGASAHESRRQPRVAEDVERTRCRSTAGTPETGQHHMSSPLTCPVCPAMCRARHRVSACSTCMCMQLATNGGDRERWILSPFVCAWF